MSEDGQTPAQTHPLAGQEQRAHVDADSFPNVNPSCRLFSEEIFSVSNTSYLTQTYLFGEETAAWIAVGEKVSNCNFPRHGESG